MASVRGAEIFFLYCNNQGSPLEAKLHQLLQVHKVGLREYQYSRTTVFLNPSQNKSFPSNVSLVKSRIMGWGEGK